MDSLLESIVEELEDLEKQRRQLEEEVEAEQHPTAPQMKQMTVESPRVLHTAQQNPGVHGGDGPRLRTVGSYEAQDVGCCFSLRADAL